jgi:hypothetical protein
MKYTKAAWFAVIRNPARGPQDDSIESVAVNDPDYPVNPEMYTVSSCGGFYYWAANKVILGQPQLVHIEYEDEPPTELEVLDRQEAAARAALEQALDQIKARRMELAMLTYQPPA